MLKAEWETAFTQETDVPVLIECWPESALQETFCNSVIVKQLSVIHTNWKYFINIPKDTQMSLLITNYYTENQSNFIVSCNN